MSIPAPTIPTIFPDRSRMTSLCQTITRSSLLHVRIGFSWDPAISLPPERSRSNTLRTSCRIWGGRKVSNQSLPTISSSEQPRSSHPFLLICITWPSLSRVTTKIPVASNARSAASFLMTALFSSLSACIVQCPLRHYTVILPRYPRICTHLPSFKSISDCTV